MRQLFYGGTILTLSQPLYTEALLEEDGEILAIGSLALLRTELGNGKLVDLAGGVLLPAFLDAHGHLSQMAVQRLQVSLAGCRSIEEIGQRLQTFLSSRQLPQGSWIQACGYDHNQLPDAKGPTLSELDAWVPQHPLLISHQSGHFGLCNSCALQALGITAKTPDPAGGVIGRTDGALTGLLEENAYFQVQKQLPLPKFSVLADAFQAAQQEYAANGIVTVQEGLMTTELLALYDGLLRQNVLFLDTVGYASPDALPAAVAQFPQSIGRYDRHFRLGGVKIFLDGSPQARTAWMRTPYADSNACGYGVLNDAAVRDAMQLAATGGWQLLAHCNGDAAAAQFLRCLREMNPSELRLLRPVLIHGQLLDIDQLEEVAELGVIPSFFVAHVYHWGDTHIRSFGLSRAMRISPAAAALERGIRFTFHQDAPVIPPNMIETLWCAVNRLTRDGVVLGPEQRISPLAALRAVTCNAAYQYFEEAQHGTLTPGKASDFVVLDRDPLSIPPEALRELRVLATYCRGQRIYSA